MLSLVYVCDSGYRNRRQYPIIGHFETEPSTTVNITATSDNYCTAAPYDNGAITIDPADPVTEVSVVYLGGAVRSENFYAGHVFTLFDTLGVRSTHTVLSSYPSTTTKTRLVLATGVPVVLVATVMYYWLSQSVPIEAQAAATVNTVYTLVVSPTAWVYRPDNEIRYALLVYQVVAAVPTPMAPFPAICYVRDVQAWDGANVHDGPPLPGEQCLVTLADAVPFAPASVIVIDWMKINGVTNGNNVGNARYPARFLSQTCPSRWPLSSPPSGPNLYRVQLQHVVLPTYVPVRSLPSPNDTESLRDPDVPRYGGFVTDFPYVVVQLAVNQRFRPHTVVVPSQAPVAGSFIAVMETFRNNMKAFVVAHCHGPVYIPADEWETVIVTIRLPNGDVVDFDPHPAMLKRPMYAGPDPLTQVQCIFVVDCAGR